MVDRRSRVDRRWVDEVVRRVEADANRSADTHLLAFPLPRAWGDLYLKDESTHPTRSLKHRLARSLFLYALCNGWIHEGTTVVEASSGSTAVSDAYFARMPGLPFVAVVQASTSPEKIALIEFYGGRCHLVSDRGQVCDESRSVAAETGGHFLDQFTYAERATDWRGNNNIAESIYEQLAHERHPVPRWIVVGAGTGGTGATIGRYVRYRRHDTRLCVVDPERSAFFDSWVAGDAAVTSCLPSRIEGIGRPRVEPLFLPGVVDRMVRVSDAASIAAMRVVERVLGRRPGASTGTNVWGALQLVTELRAAGRAGSVSRCCATPASATRIRTTTTSGWPRRAWTSRRTPRCSKGSCERANGRRHSGTVVALPASIRGEQTTRGRRPHAARASAGVLLTMLAVAGCGAAEADRSATSGGATTAAPGAAGDAATPKLFACSRESRVFGPPPAVPEAGRLTRIVRRVDAFRGEGYNARARGEGCAGGGTARASSARNGSACRGLSNGRCLCLRRQPRCSRPSRRVPLAVHVCPSTQWPQRRDAVRLVKLANRLVGGAVRVDVGQHGQAPRSSAGSRCPPRDWAFARQRGT